MLPAPPIHRRTSSLGLSLGLAIAALSGFARAQCPELGPVSVYQGAGTITCPCFVAGEEAGTVFSTIPANDFPIAITKIGIGWGSQAGGALPTVEDSINIYGAGLPNPGAPLYQFFAPQMTDGFLNEFDVENAGMGTITVNAQPFTVTLKFFNPNDSCVACPSVVEDGNGCTPGKSVIKAVSGIPAGWYNFCALGGSGDWLVYIKYRANCGGGGGSTGTGFCFGDGSGNTCPCDPGQAGGPGEGCMNSTGVGGHLTASGTAQVTNDTLVMHLAGLPGATTGLLFQGTIKQNGGQGSQLADGLLCVNGTIVRLGTKVQSAGMSDWGFGVPGDTPISVHGAIPGGGGTRYYQGWYRNAANFCTAATSNYTNGLEIIWAP